MRPGNGRLTAALVGPAVLPGVAAAGSVDPSTVTGAPTVARGAASVLLVGLVGGAILFRYGPFVDRAVDDTMGRPAVAVPYGLAAYVLVLFPGFYANNLLARAGVADTPAGLLVLVLLVGGVLVLGGLGFLVVGTLLTDLFGARRPRRGLVLGAVVSGGCWLVTPVAGALAAWLLVAAFGVGGPTRTWVHRSQPVASERDA